jgi:uncharacterized protein
VPTTKPEDIAAYANRVASTWKIGRREVGDGLLVVVAKNDRTVRIEVARALEGAVPDAAARQIIDQRIVPAFREGDFHAGLDRGLDVLMARIRGEALPAPSRSAELPDHESEHVTGLLGAVIFFAGLIAVIALALLTSIALAGAEASRRHGLPLAIVLSVLLAVVPTAGMLLVSFSWIVVVVMVVSAAYTITALLLLRRSVRPRILRSFVLYRGPGDAACSSDGGSSSSDTGWSSSDSGGFSSGGGGSFGGGGASGRW